MINVYGLTGVMGAGKSTISSILKQLFLNYSKNLHIIEVDQIRRYILWESIEKNHILVQKKISNFFNSQNKNNHKIINRATFSSFIFKNHENMEIFSLLVTPYIKKEIETIISKNNDSIIVWSYLLEEQYSMFLNQPLFLIQCSEKNCYQRLIEQSAREKDDLPLKELIQRMQIFTNYEKKINICKNNNIKYFEIDNNFFNLKATTSLIKQILKVKNDTTFK